MPLIVLPICAAVDVEVRNTVGNAIKRLEILDCAAEPCTLTLGKSINVSITFQADFEVPEDSPTIETFINLWTGYYRYDRQYAVTDYDETKAVVLKSAYTVLKTIWICTDKVYYEWNDPDQSRPNYGTPLGIRDVVFELADHGWYSYRKVLAAAAFRPTNIEAEAVLALGITGNTEASQTLRLFAPLTLNWGSTTTSGLSIAPIRQLPAG
ncbi:unnamed protein product [Medioppia subpectinata]|uniref:Uncharacterized protein n=1 Tax=Medioppia subpectinata TaxID=1979941 RepID=A0A7R9KLB4_9ACAR|nr:unnamed protein product [Medioppia subpectinata]CAG2105733.1 unnamed protein product [Medioppia subpectinata]